LNLDIRHRKHSSDSCKHPIRKTKPSNQTHPRLDILEISSPCIAPFTGSERV
jgi:hypothetical protein